MAEALASPSQGARHAPLPRAAHLPRRLAFPIDENGRKAVTGIVAGNGAEQVTWVHSYVSDDDRTTWCIYDAPSLEAIRAAAGTNSLPVDAIHAVNVLDPYFYAAS